MIDELHNSYCFTCNIGDNSHYNKCAKHPWFSILKTRGDRAKNDRIANMLPKIPGSITYKAVIMIPRSADLSMPTPWFLPVRAFSAIICLPIATTTR